MPVAIPCLEERMSSIKVKTYPVTLIAPTGKEQDVLLRISGDGVRLLTVDERVSTLRMSMFMGDRWGKAKTVTQ